MSLIKTKFLEDNAVNDLKLRLRNNLALRVRNQADSADVEIFKLSTSDIFEVLREMSMTNNKITNLADPSNALDAVNKQYLDSVLAGLTDPKDSVRIATTGVLPANTYDNGVAGVGATLTADVNGAIPSIDGVGLSVGQRILVKNEVAGLGNGIYVITQLGDAGNPYILTRSGDADNSGPSSLVTQGMFVRVSEGSDNGTLGFMLTTGNPIVLGTTSLGFSQMGEVIAPGLGITKTGQTIAVDEGAGLGFSGNQLVVLVDDLTLTDGTIKIVADKVSGRIGGKHTVVLSGTDISNQYIDLTVVANRDTIILQPSGGPKQNEVLDFTVSYTGGAASKSRITFAGDLATAGNAALASGDILYITYQTLDY